MSVADGENRRTISAYTRWNYRCQQIEINSYPDSPLFISTGFLPRVSSMRLNWSVIWLQSRNDDNRRRTTTTTKQKNGLPQGSVLSPILFNIYINDQPLHNGTRSFIYADDLCVTAQQPSFVEVETTIEELLSELAQYYRSNNVRANLDKTQVTAFHLRNKENVKDAMEQDRYGEYTPS